MTGWRSVIIGASLAAALAVGLMGAQRADARAQLEGGSDPWQVADYPA